MLRHTHSFSKTFRVILLASVAALALGACASNRTSLRSPDYSGLSQAQTQATLAELAARYQASPRDKQTVIYYSAALRAAGQSGQAVAVLEQAIPAHKDDADVNIAFAKALTADGKFARALRIIDATLRADAPDWNALSVKGAIFDQTGRNIEARALYNQALLIAPTEASLEANLGLSYAMTNDLGQAEAHLRKATKMRGATSQIRQNLALVLGLQGQFDAARAIYTNELPAAEVESNMAYIRALLTQQNRWDVIKDNG